MIRQYAVPLDEPAAWDRALDAVPHAFAHTWANCSAMQLTTGWPTFLWVLESKAGRTVLPFAERSIGDLTDVVTPYGFGGFAGAAASPDLLLREWHQFARRRGYVCGYLGLSPVLAPGGLDRMAGYRAHNEAFVLDLAQGRDALFLGLSPNRRRNLRQVGTAPIDRDRAALAGFFIEQIGPFLKARGAGRAYLFGEATWRALLQSDQVLLLGRRGHDGEILAVCALAHTAHAGDYLFSVASPEATGLTESLLWAGALELVEHGVPTLNLGGGVRKDDSLAEFKRRFGGSRLPVGAMAEIYRPDAYQDLCDRAGVVAENSDAYFPAYRNPVLTSAVP